MSNPCTHVAPPDLEAFMLADYTRQPDVCHKVHLYTLAGPVLDVRISVGPQGNTAMARLAGLPNKVIGLWWDAAVWQSFLDNMPQAGPAWDFSRSVAFFASAEGQLRAAIAAIGLGDAEKACAKLAAARKAAPAGVAAAMGSP